MALKERCEKIGLKIGKGDIYVEIYKENCKREKQKSINGFQYNNQEF